MEERKKVLFYINDENKLNEYERKYKKISYKTLVNYYTQGHIILCNNIVNIDEFLFDNIVNGELYNEEEDYYKDIYQYFIIDLNQWELEEIQKYYNNDLIICYSEKLDNYILCVDHFGTSWDYVLTDIEYTTNWEEYQKSKEA